MRTQRSLELNVKRYMHDKLHCRMSEDEGQGDWVLFEEVKRLMTYLSTLKIGVDITERAAIHIAKILTPLPLSEDELEEERIRFGKLIPNAKPISCSHVWNEYEYDTRCIYCGAKKQS